MADDHSGVNSCDKATGASKCLSGITGLNQSKGIPMWRCSEIDFDMCIKCAQADKGIEALLYKPTSEESKPEEEVKLPPIAEANKPQSRAESEEPSQPKEELKLPPIDKA